MSGEGTKSSDQTHDQTGGRVQPAHLSQFLPTLSAILLRNNVNDGCRKLTPGSLPPLGMSLPVRYVSTPQLQPQKPHQSEDRSQVRRTVRGCDRLEGKKTEVKTEVTTERDTQEAPLVRLPVSQCTTEQHSQYSDVKIEIDDAEEPPLAWCMTQQQPQSVERSQARQTVSGCDRMEEEEWTVKTEVKIERDTQEPLLVRLPVSQCMTEQHSQEPEVKTEVKIEIDVAEEPPQAWCMTQQHSQEPEVKIEIDVAEEPPLAWCMAQQHSHDETVSAESAGRYAFQARPPASSIENAQDGSRSSESRGKLYYKTLVEFHKETGTLEEFRQSLAERQKDYRTHRQTPEAKLKHNERARVAMQALRQRKRDAAEAELTTRAGLEEKAKEDAQKKLANTEYQRKRRANMTQEKKDQINTQRKENRKKKKEAEEKKPKPQKPQETIPKTSIGSPFKSPEALLPQEHQSMNQKTEQNWSNYGSIR
ncbi:caldesmon-like isoform X2 [Littorina saxatilis]|uniref:caldesmon-like isoform X2 n=1 Tax=Littorina saxatilis TaxID=31220 RepID=UPI0038B5599A